MKYLNLNNNKFVDKITILIVVIFSLTICSYTLYAQTPPQITGQSLIGGSAAESITYTIPTSDGGYFIATSSTSGISGDKSEMSQGGFDIWIVKLDSMWNVQWENTIGGSDVDFSCGAQQTSDGGYIVIAWSNSNISGDKTENNLGSGNSDFWILRVNSSGSVIWQKTIGGSGDDKPSKVIQTLDGGYLIAGYSDSDSSLYKSENNIGGGGPGIYDYWIVKLDSIGNIEWENTIGGSGSDLATDVAEISLGSFVIIGTSNSGISGDKTESVIGQNDLWIMKLNSIGNIVWQHTIGGSGDDRAPKIMPNNPNGSYSGFLVSASSDSDISGDKTENNKGQPGTTDIWILKLNLTGSVIWDKTIGGNLSDHGKLITYDDDKYYVLGGSWSDVSGDKSQPSFGADDYWVLELDSLGNSLWDLTIGGDSNDSYTDGFINPADTGIVLSGYSGSSNSGNLNVTSNGGSDIFLIKIGGNQINNNGNCNKPDFVSLGTERTTALCPDDSVKIFVVNPQGPGLTYQWYKSDAVIPGAVDSFYYASEVRKYKVRVSNGPNCFRTSGRIQPTVAIPPTVSITPQGSTDICAGDSVLLVANYVPGYSYQWRRYGVDIPGATDTMHYASQPGNYKIFITNDGGCISKSSNVSVNIVCRIAGSSVANDVEVMPNPTSDNFSVKLNDLGEEVPLTVEFIDQQGRLMQSRRVNGQTLLDFTAMGLSNGNYTVIVRFESGETVEKVVSVVR